MASAQIPILPSTGQNGAPSGTVLLRPQYRVYVKDKWGGSSWTYAPYLVPLQATIASAPSKSVAHFRWRTGRIKHEDQAAFRDYGRLADVRDKFVRIDVLEKGKGASRLFVGRFGEDETDYQGADTGSWTRALQSLTAYGLEDELDRSPIRGSFVTNGGDSPTGLFIDTPLVFNEQFDRRGPTNVGNRSLTKVEVSGQFEDPDVDRVASEYVFAGKKPTDGSSAVAPWTVGDIVRYLLAFHAPVGIPFVLGGQAAVLDDFILPRVSLAGRTVFEALNYLIDRRRGIGWCLRPPGKDGGSVEVHVHSLLDTAIPYFGGADGKTKKTIPANTEQETLELDKLAHLVDEQSVLFDSLATYGKVVVSGARLLVCFTAGIVSSPGGQQFNDPESSLQAGWMPAEETRYRNGAGLTDGADAAKKNDQARADVQRQHVFSHFRLRPDWAWRAGGHNCNPLVDADGRVRVDDSKQAPIRKWGLRVERHLPFPIPTDDSELEPEFEKPFAVLFDDKTKRWVHAHHTGSGPRATITPLDNDFGFKLDFTPNHRLAKGWWSGAKPSAVNPDTAKDCYDWSKMSATIAVRTDERLQVEVEIDKSEALRDRVRHIEIPDAEYHYLVPGTIRSVKGTAPAEDADKSAFFNVSTKDEAVVRDDGDRLRQVAAMAKAWYGTERAAVRLTVKDVWQRYPVGTMIRSASTGTTGGQKIGSTTRVGKSRPVNTVVSQVTYDLVAGTTSYATSFVELDVTPAHSAGPKHT
jgi:hypothetical protein